MSNDIKESSRQTGATQYASGQDCRTVPLEEMRRQLGLNLIEAARDQFGSEGYASLLRYRNARTMKNYDRNVHQDATLGELMTALPMTAEAYAALLRKKIANRRAIEDRRMAAQVFDEPYGSPT
jgi:hypothetical protein